MTADRPTAETDGAPTSWDAPLWPEDDSARAAGETGSTGTVANPVDSRRAEARRHREVLVASCLAIVAAFAMVEVSGGRVAFRGFTGYPLPHACASRAILGWKCPGCGLTRSVLHLARGDWRSSWRSHRLGMLMAAAIVAQVPYRMLALRHPGRPPIPAGWMSAGGLALIALLLLNWLAEVVTARLGSV
ncbi:MAG: DUF2752 domain-containing protein [Isosphaeraceae bacterium]